MGMRKRLPAGLATGCMVVAAIAGVFVIWALVVTGKAFMARGSEQIESRAFSHEVPTPDETRPKGEAGTPTPLRVVLDLTVGFFIVGPGPPGRGIEVDASFDIRSYALDQSYEQGAAGDTYRVTYRVTFREIGLIRDGGLRGLFGGSYPRMRVSLPPDVPLILEGKFSKGATTVDLGGLWLIHADLRQEKGGFYVRVDTPTREPVETLKLHARQGGFTATNLGNASPRVLDINTGMGGSTVNLRGQWLRDADVRFHNLMGGSNLILPRNVRLEGVDPPNPVPPWPRDDELPPPTLRITITKTLAGIDVRQ